MISLIQIFVYMYKGIYITNNFYFFNYNIYPDIKKRKYKYIEENNINVLNHI